jgi:p-hydroxybenzoate 3-monooxygenase
MLHNLGDEFERRIMDSQLDYFTGTKEGLKVIAEQYVGLPYEEVE